MKSLIPRFGALAAACLAPTFVSAADTAAAPTEIRVDTTQVTARIAPEIYGQFAEHLGHCIYEGLWVGEDSSIPNTRGIRNDVVAALKELQIPVLRWPGGCFADEYHWKDGIGPREDRPSMINTHWGAVVENNHFGTHEFFDLVEMLGTKAYVCGNVGSGSPQEMMEWVEYMTSDAQSPMANLRRQNGRDKPWKLDYFGVGNESWGCGGNMRPEFYADLYRQFNTFVKNYDRQNPVYRIAGGANGDDANWTETLMERAGRHMNGLSLHYYTLPTGDWGPKGKGSATNFDETVYHTTLWRTLKMEDIVIKHDAIMDKYDPEQRVGMMIDEWGIWTDVEPGTNPGFLFQQNSLRDALIASVNFDIFHRHADRIRMTNIAQMVNVLQAMILTDKDKMVRTPTYWAFEMYKVHQGNDALALDLWTPDYTIDDKTIPQVSATASRDPETGVLYLAFTNLHATQSAPLKVRLNGLEKGTVQNARVLTAAAVNSINTFDQPNAVQPVAFKGAKLAGDALTLTMPSKSIVVLEIKP